MQAKLDLPVVNDVFARERLGEALALALTARVFVVQAGPGSGKTALLASVIRQRGLPCVWLHVDQADADPHRFARYLLAGLARVGGDGNGGGFGADNRDGVNGADATGGAGNDVDVDGGGEALVAPAVASDQETLLARLLAAIEGAVAAAAVRPLVLVFDDFDQAAGEATPELVTRLADYLPAGATIWLSCRKTPNLPLRRWQALRLATRLDQTDLALTPAEVVVFCRKVLGIELDEAAAEIVYRACSGWIGGLILMSAALRKRTQAALVDAAQRLLRRLSPREATSGRRPAPGAEPPLGEGAANPLHPLVEYVSSEVISRQPPELQRLVTYAAVLPFVTAGAAAELTGEPLAAVVGLMNKAADLMPLVIRLEHGRLAYHPMLRASLLERLVQLEGSLRLAQLRAVAGDYLAANGWPEEALDCLIQGGHFDRAVAILDGKVLPLALHGRTATVGAWLDRLPWDLVAGRPALLAAIGVVRQAAGRLEEALMYWRQALDLVVAGSSGGGAGADDGGDSGRAVAATCRALIATVLADRGRADEGREVLAPTLAEPDGQLAASDRARLLNAMAFCQWMSDEWDKAWQTAQDAATWYSRAGDPFGEAAVLNVLGGMFHEPRGQYERTLACMGQAIELVEPHGVSPQLLLYKANFGHILTELGRTNESVEILAQTVKAGERLGVGKALMLARMFLAQAYLDLARFTDCRVEFERALAMAQEMGDKLRIGGIYYGMANMHRDRGELDLALDLAGRDLALMREIGNAHFLLQSLLNVGFVHLHRGEPDAARRVLAEAERCAADRPLGLEGVRLYFGLAAAALLADEPEAYPDYLERGLALCQGRDCTIVFVRDRRVIEPVLRRGVADGVRVTACQNLLGALGDMVEDLAGHPAAMTSNGGAMGEPIRVLPGPVRVPDDKGLVVSCLGRFLVQLDGVAVPVSAWPKTKALRLFKLLLANRARWVPVEQIVEVLWPEMRLSPALANFRVTLHHARRVLAEAGASRPRGLLLYEQRRCRISPDELTWVDADQFTELVGEAKRLAAAGQAAAAAAAYRAADNLYGGDFLPDDVYEDWAARPREELRAMAVAGLEWLANYRLDLGRPGAAVAHLVRALGLDSYREDLHRQLMSALAAAGRVAEAIAAYRRCEQLLVKELNVAPAQETVDLYRRLLQSNQPAG